MSVECARLLGKAAASGRAKFRSTLLFGVLSGEEQGLLGAYRLLEWTKEQGYTVGAMLDNDIVGADPAPGSPHRVRVLQELIVPCSRSLLRIRHRREISHR